MIKQVFALGAAVAMLAGAVLADAPSQGAGGKGQATEAAPLTEVMVCPMTLEAVEGKGAGSEIVGQNRVHFCCGGCQPAFDKLSQQQKEAKVAAALQKQEAAKKVTQ